MCSMMFCWLRPDHQPAVPGACRARGMLPSRGGLPHRAPLQGPEPALSSRPRAPPIRGGGKPSRLVGCQFPVFLVFSRGTTPLPHRLPCVNSRGQGGGVPAGCAFVAARGEPPPQGVSGRPRHEPAHVHRRRRQGAHRAQQSRPSKPHHCNHTPRRSVQTSTTEPDWICALSWRDPRTGLCHENYPLTGH